MISDRSVRRWLGAVLVGASCISLSPGANAQGHEGLLGIWVPDATPDALKTADGKAPPLTAEGAKIYRSHLAERKTPQPQYDRTRWCAGPGMPRVMFMPYPIEIKADRDYVAILSGWYRWYRTIDLSGAAPEIVLPKTMGYSVGKWEGDTLVVTTTGLTPDTVLDPSGLPHSEDMTITERFRLRPDRHLEVRFTIADSATYSKPWDTIMTYHRDANAKVADDLCPDRIARGEAAVRKAMK